MARVPMVDMSGAYLLDDIIEKAHHQGATVFFTGLRPQVERTLTRLKIIEKVTEDNCLATFNDAILRIQHLEHEQGSLSDQVEQNTLEHV